MENHYVVVCACHDEQREYKNFQDATDVFEAMVNGLHEEIALFHKVSD